MPVYVHAPYVVNLASPNNRIRIPSRKILQQACDGAADINATAVIVHGGHVEAGEDEADGFERWVKGLQQLETTVPGAAREHRRRRPCHGPQVRHAGPAVGPHRPVRHRLLPRHLPRPRRRRDRHRRGRPHPRHHRPHRPRALQRLEGPRGLGPRPPREPGQGHHRRRRSSPRSSARPTPRSSARPPPPARPTTSPS